MKVLKIGISIILCCFIAVGNAQLASYSTSAITHDLMFFTDWTGSKLVDGFKKKQLKNFSSPLMRSVAEALYRDQYDATYRLHAYKPVPSNKELVDKLKLYDGYSNYENMTGMYLEAGEHVILAGDFHGRSVGLLIPDWMRQPTPGFKPTEDPEGWGLKRQYIALHEGVNVIYVEKSGNVYVDYYVDDPETAPAITLHFLTGKVNGYFDSSIQNNNDWNTLLDCAVSPVLDVKGKYMQLAYPVEYLKKYAYGEGEELVNCYDRIMEAQYRFSGAIKYNRIPNKRILARVNYNYFMFRDGDGVAFEGTDGTMKEALSSLVITNWGIHHEIGHVMQMRPQLTWGGMTEVSNNLFSMYGTMSLGASSRLVDDKVYESAFREVLDAPEKPFILTVQDPFRKLVPFWQLHVYFYKKGYPDFYADVMEYMRTHPHRGDGNASIRNMYEFVKICCDIGKTDLLDFFEAWGFFVPGTYDVDDYTHYRFEVTSEMIEETREYVESKHYPKADECIFRLTD